ncbi:hypothetical protein ACKWTF_014581 [Chironomus riparius]
MTVPRTSQFCCLSLKFVNQVWVWVHFVLLVFVYLTTISIGVIRLLKLNYDDYTTAKDEILQIIEKEIKVEINAQNWVALFTILMVLIMICHYHLNGIKKNIPQNLLPFTFLNALAGVAIIVYKISNIDEYFCLGAIYCFAAICSYSLYDDMLVQNMEIIEKRILEASQQTRNTNQISMYPQVPPPYSKNNHIV